MAKNLVNKFVTTADRNRTIKSLDLEKGDYNLYMVEKGYGLVHKLRQQKDKDGINEYVYTGRFHKGGMTFYSGKNLEIEVPNKNNYNYGYTFEGIADKIFYTKDSLNKYSEQEKRTFCYIKGDSTLYYGDDPFGIYTIYIKLYENCYGINNYRWAVIYACKPNEEELERMKRGEY